MTVNLLLVLLLEAEQDLGRHDAFVRVAELNVLVEGKRGCVLKDMGGDLRRQSRLVPEIELRLWRAGGPPPR